MVCPDPANFYYGGNGGYGVSREPISGDGDSAHAQLQEWAGKTAVTLVLYDDAGNQLIG